MSEMNKRLVRRVIDEIWSGGKLELIDQLYAEDFSCHCEPMGDWVGRSGVREVVTQMHEMLAEYNERIDDLIAEGDTVVVRLTISGISLGRNNVVDKPVSTLGILIYRIANDQIAEQWEVVNMAGIMEQIDLASK